MSPLDGLEVRSPCTVPWEGMKGDDRIRFCSLCRLNVYNLSGMPRREAEALVEGASGRLCVRYFRRPDGTVLFRNCRSVRLLRRAVAAAVWLVASAVVGFLVWASSAAAFALRREGAAGIPKVEPFRTIQAWADPDPVVVVGKVAIMGELCVPSPPPQIDHGAASVD